MNVFSHIAIYSKNYPVDMQLVERVLFGRVEYTRVRNTNEIVTNTENYYKVVRLIETQGYTAH